MKELGVIMTLAIRLSPKWVGKKVVLAIRKVLMKLVSQHSLAVGSTVLVNMRMLESLLISGLLVKKSRIRLMI